MPTFNTPEPITVTVELVAGHARIAATERLDTVVDVHPSDSSNESDVRAATDTSVEWAGGRLLVRTPKQRARSRLGRPGSVDVTIEVPIGSRFHGAVVAGSFTCSGRLGDCRVHGAAGDLRFEDTGALDVSMATGELVAGRVTGDVEVRSGSGRVRVEAIDGSASIKMSDGDTWIGRISGALQIKTAHGDATIDGAGTDMAMATARGDLRVGGLTQGSAVFKTGHGDIEIGIAEGTAAHLNVHTALGQVHRLLETADGPTTSEGTVDVRARTGWGDITLSRTPTLLGTSQERR